MIKPWCIFVRLCISMTILTEIRIITFTFSFGEKKYHVKCQMRVYRRIIKMFDEEENFKLFSDCHLFNRKRKEVGKSMPSLEKNLALSSCRWMLDHNREWAKEKLRNYSVDVFSVNNVNSGKEKRAESEKQNWEIDWSRKKELNERKTAFERRDRKSNKNRFPLFVRHTIILPD